MSQIHEYPVQVIWQGGREGAGNVVAERSQTEAVLSVPTEFGGPGTGTNPEELLTAAIAACYSVTFGIVAGARRIPYTSIETKAVGEVEQPNAATFTYKRITLRPKITLPAGTDEATVKLCEEMSHKADAYCIITNAVRGKVEIVVKPDIVIA